ncbi:unnamed protein product [Cyprideis torosa]|uniref:Protein Wnt n=1 Tax=Cyprideis torosa TaxID=163714 RepID=A0A7R8ZIW7_9CRUS|nr:unnamed protein product [Cyprideis torosa]CAG0880916.1 unnamed protein product [Cyprideis torosa]
MMLIGSDLIMNQNASLIHSLVTSVFRWTVLIYSLASTALTTPRITGSWLNLGMQGYHVWHTPPNYLTASQTLCTDIPGLSKGQRRICELYQDHMSHVGLGARQGIEECQYQFKNQRWNCSTVEDPTVLGPIIEHLSPSMLMIRRMRLTNLVENFKPKFPRTSVPFPFLASREAAFAHAIGAAGVVHAVSRACRDGQLSTCSCSWEKRPKELQLHKDWIWGGCGDNIEYGYKFTQSFVDIREREEELKGDTKGLSMMNLHNNEAGRRAVYRKAKITCKCHGVSGSCSLITCWRQLAPFREVGDFLKQKYDGSTRVKINRRGRLQVRKRRHVVPTAEDLIYLQPSPDYCNRNESLRLPGTPGRPCNRTSEGMDGCDLLCCSRGYNTERIIVHERCDCKFHWCCYVECKSCRRRVELNTCK